MKKLMLIAVAAFCFAACGNSNANNEAAAETKAAHECTECTKAAADSTHKCNHAEGEHKCNHAEGEHKCNHAAADSTKHECNHAEGEAHECNKPADQKCDKCKEAEAAKAEQAK